ncbi:conserved hypothetical protein [Gloeothece citriformis PCC 7424]|uniref:Uncharacterized protein n=1 Tax=Gloeothece citriformis (strain PCC 7424) TaxID=65393 RepID=B7K930_GLOC7|nr:hypothetical protein [Gloeothece citriformis]ACK72799.1 conserved hypothetical protein [Gloeothece citriformis PCC 7424]
MKLSKIDLSKIIAVNHNQDKLGLLIDRGSEVEYLEVPAPKVAYQGLNQVANLANNPPSLADNSLLALDHSTLSNPLNTTHQPSSVSYSASIEIDENKKVLKVELTCQLEYSLEELDDYEEEYDDFEDYFYDEEEEEIC